MTHGNLTSLKQTVLSSFWSKFTFIYTKLKLKTCHTRRFSFKNDIGKMTTVFLDAVFKPFFFLNRPWHGPTTADRSDKFTDGWLPSNHSTYGVCDCKHAIPNTPKRKNHTLKDRESEGATAHLLTNASYTNTRCPTGQVSIATEVANTEEKNADHLVLLLGIPTEYYPFKRCPVLNIAEVGEPFYWRWLICCLTLHYDKW